MWFWIWVLRPRRPREPYEGTHPMLVVFWLMTTIYAVSNGPLAVLDAVVIEGSTLSRLLVLWWVVMGLEILVGLRSLSAAARPVP